MKNHYEILGLESNASTEDIKKAYHKLSLKFHPDKNGGDEYFSALFRQINDAYLVLSDDEKRRSYDQMRIRSAESQSFAEALKKRENELNYREQQLQRPSAYETGSTYRKTDISDSIKPERSFDIKYLKYSLWILIVVLVALLASKNKPVDVSTEPASAVAIHHHGHKHKKQISKPKHNIASPDEQVNNPSIVDTSKRKVIIDSASTN